MTKRDTIHGNTYLHIACQNQNIEIAKIILARSPSEINQQ